MAGDEQDLPRAPAHGISEAPQYKFFFMSKSEPRRKRENATRGRDPHIERRKIWQGNNITLPKQFRE